MEEITPAPPPESAPRQRRFPLPPDFADMGIQVDQSGKIIPLIRKDQPPVQQPFSRLDVDDEPWWNFAPPVVASPYGGLFSPWGVPVDAWGRPMYPYGSVPGFTPWYGYRYPYWPAVPRNLSPAPTMPGMSPGPASPGMSPAPAPRYFGPSWAPFFY